MQNESSAKLNCYVLYSLECFEHENIISLLDVIRPDGKTGFEDIYFVTDLMETDLHRVVYSHQDLTDEHIQYFIY